MIPVPTTVKEEDDSLWSLVEMGLQNMQTERPGDSFSQISLILGKGPSIVDTILEDKVKITGCLDLEAESGIY